MKASDQLADGILFPEGLGWETATQTLVTASVQTATVFRIWPTERRKEVIAELGKGGANNLTLAAGGGIVVCQNGGVDAGPPMAANYPDMEPLPPQETTTPGLLYLSPGGDVTYILDEGINAPNDITVDASGDLVFTDPGNPFHSPRPDPRLMRWSPTAGLTVIADGFGYCNGIFADGESLSSPTTAASCASLPMARVSGSFSTTTATSTVSPSTATGESTWRGRPTAAST